MNYQKLCKLADDFVLCMWNELGITRTQLIIGVCAVMGLTFTATLWNIPMVLVWWWFTYGQLKNVKIYGVDLTNTMNVMVRPRLESTFYLCFAFTVISALLWGITGHFLATIAVFAIPVNLVLSCAVIPTEPRDPKWFRKNVEAFA